jgi:hypothetical protein
MLFGGYLSGRETNGNPSAIRSFFILIATLILYYSIPLLISMGHGGPFQFMTHLLMFPIAFLFLSVVQSDNVIRKLKDYPVLVSGVSLISAMTLEIYLVHGSFHSNSLILSFAFPANLIVFLFVTLLLALMLNRTTGFVREVVLKRVTSNTR